MRASTAARALLRLLFVASSTLLGLVVLPISACIELLHVLHAVLSKHGILSPVPHNLSQRYGKCWAVVFGASSGIGLAFARELAAQGFDVVLVARRIERLDGIAAEITRQFGVKAVALRADLSSLTDSGVKELAATITAGRAVGILIVNAGVSDINWHFTDQPLARTREMVSTNCLALALLVHELLPPLVCRASKADRRALIVSLGAVNSVLPLAQHSLSSGTKAFVRYFSHAVGMTVEEHVDMLCAHPIGVHSEILKKEPDGFILAPDAFARGILAQAGHSRESCGWWAHELAFQITMRLPSDRVARAFYEYTGQMASDYLQRDLCERDLAPKMLAQMTEG